jgi:Protein of unknown function (DUF1549)/Protein of unknown function (DUF1553)
MPGLVWQRARSALTCALLAIAIASPPCARAAEDQPSPTDHWAFRGVHRPDVPHVGNTAWARNPIDAFILAQHDAHGLQSVGEADKRTLIRRLTLDLTGLPPAPPEVDAFLNDTSPQAYEHLVERVLASPRYGERWARHWLDAARYADTEGYESNHERPYMWRYRDYVVDAFNRDKPYDRFIREQIAGDEIEPYSDENLIATGFLANARLSSNEEDKAMQRNDVLVDVVNATASAVLGLTLGCAQCHDHKLEPFTQHDYYAFQAFFVKGQPNNLVLKDAKLWRDFNAAKVEGYDEAVRLKAILYHKGVAARNAVVFKEFSDEQKAALATPDADRTAPQRELARLASLRMQATPGEFERFIPDDDKKLYQELKKKLEAMKKTMPDEPQAWGFYSPVTSPHHVDVLPMKAFYPLPYNPPFLAEAQAYVLTRGDVHQRGDRVQPAWPAVLSSRREPSAPGSNAHPTSRSDLADWLTGTQNPLTARVWVNRIWQHHFGRGLVATPGDFGTHGARPTLPGVLDWLAAELMDHGWSTRHIHRLIVTSSTYRQSAAESGKPKGQSGKQKAESGAAEGDSSHRTSHIAGRTSPDPDNLYLWHYPTRRLEMEAIRDSVLAVTGELTGRPPKGLVPVEEADTALCRSLYIEQKRDAFAEMHVLFDAPTANESCAVRTVSTVALQPLYLLNSRFMHARAQAFAKRVWDKAGDDLAKQIDTAFEIALARPPTDDDRAAAEAFMNDPKHHDAEQKEAPPTRLVHFCAAVLNLDEFLYVP